MDLMVLNKLCVLLEDRAKAYWNKLKFAYIMLFFQFSDAVLRDIMPLDLNQKPKEWKFSKDIFQEALFSNLFVVQTLTDGHLQSLDIAILTTKDKRPKLEREIVITKSNQIKNPCDMDIVYHWHSCEVDVRRELDAVSSVCSFKTVF